ncbi:MFS transporter [Streptomyces longisporoflavus]|uniref:MFS transporter n=1 Tax=Streptomyces longisporoflavus TaxID=28044 RepID=UPI00167D7231|nr:MFS transporter [Streptomyces longisporoflavus]GGV71938.1 MFS transporter [Streptomyces longisporoflavus]
MPAPTTPPLSTDVPSGRRTHPGGWPAVIAVTLGIFSIVTTEILPIGLLTPIGDTFGISDGTAGLMMTLPGILAAVAAPTVTVTTGRVDRRRMLCALILVLALANFLAAVAPGYWLMLVSRVLVGLVIGAFWSIGAGLASRLVPEAQVGRATAVIFSAVPLGSVIGVPAGTLLGQLAGWRAVFTVMGVVTLVVLAALVVSVPSLPPVKVTRLGVLRGLLGTPRVRVGLAATFLVVMAHFGTYTYVTPFLAEVTHAGPRTITLFLLAYGVAGIAGNFLAGTWVRRDLRLTYTAAACLLAFATLLLPVLATGRLGALVLLLVWGSAYGAVPVCSQTWFATAAPDAPEAGTVLFTSSFQATLSLGALAGGTVLDATSTTVVMVLGGCIAVLAAAVTAPVRMWGRGGAVLDRS